ncbi:MAG: ABC transporter substrate-binding protein [Chloroflexi bacterium]|nr:ABC transporter substrate-binding protein [Chloroflexota bacterium]
MKRTTFLGIAFVLSLSLILGACTPKADENAPVSGEVSVNPDTGEVESEEGDVEESDENPTLRIAVLPIIDTLPLFLAQEEALFETYDLNVELIPVSSAPELSQMVASGQADGMITDGLTVAFFNKEEIQMQIVRYAQRPTADTGHFFILGAKDSGITTPADLKGVEIGISEGTIIEYVTDRLLEKEGFDADEIQTIAVPKIPDRMALLGSGELKAAVLPDPLASLAVSQGATIVLDDTQSPEYGASVYVFSKKIIDENPEAIRDFVEVIDTAVIFLEEEPEEYGYVLENRQLVPAPLLSGYVIPPFPSGIYSEAEWADTLAWAQAKGLLSVNIPYEDAVNSSFIP